MSEYWLISAPSERNADETWNALNASVAKVKNCSVYKFYVPALKIGTLDILLADADSIVKLEMYLEGLLSRLITGLGNMLHETGMDVKDNLMVEGSKVHEYLVAFKWDIAKFSTKQTVKCILDLAHKQATQIETEFKLKYYDYVANRNAYEVADKMDQGSLLTRNLKDVVKPEDLVLDSQYICTVLVIIPKPMLQEWYRKYEHFDDTVIPRSCRIISEDQDYYLAGVSLFKVRVPNFTDAAKKSKFIIRQYIPNEVEDRKHEEKLQILLQKKNEQFQPLLKMLKHNFSEIFKTYIHIKATKMFVESVLRYGLSADFRIAIVVVDKNLVKKMRDVLHDLYKHLDAVATSESDSKSTNLERVSVMVHNSPDYYSYVTTKIYTDI